MDTKGAGMICPCCHRHGSVTKSEGGGAFVKPLTWRTTYRTVLTLALDEQGFLKKKKSTEGGKVINGGSTEGAFGRVSKR